MERTFTCSSPDTLGAPAGFLATLLKSTPVCLFSGEMGAGKTTFIKAVCKQLGAKDSISSPTFSIVNEYIYSGGKIYHFDLYRLTSMNELWDTGFEEYVNSGEICLIEWPELAEKFLTDIGLIRVNLQVTDKTRKISIQYE